LNLSTVECFILTGKLCRAMPYTVVESVLINNSPVSFETAI